MEITHCYWHLVVKNGNWQINPYIFQQIYPQCIMVYILWDVFGWPFCILQEKVGISCYFWVIRVVNSQLALCSHVRCNPLYTPKYSQNTQMAIRNFNHEGPYLPGVICNIVVKADLGRSAGRSIPQMHHGIYIMGCILQPFCILQEKVGISCYFWIMRLVNSQLALYNHVRCNPSTPPQHPKIPLKYPPKCQLEISTMR